MDLRNSPLARTPPSNLPMIPGVTCGSKVKAQPTIPEEDQARGAGDAKADISKLI